MQQRSVVYKQGSQSELPAVINVQLKQEFSPMRHGTGTMISNQQTPNKRPVESINQSPSVKKYVFKTKQIKDIKTKYNLIYLNE